MKSKFKKQDPPRPQFPKFMPGDMVKFEIESKKETVYATVEYVRVFEDGSTLYNLIGWHTAFPELRLKRVARTQFGFVTYEN